MPGLKTTAQSSAGVPVLSRLAALAGMLAIVLVISSSLTATAWAEEDKPNSWRFDDGELIANPETDDASSASANGVATQAANEGSARAASVPSSKGSVGKLIDVSKWDESIDWKKVKKSGINYAIIRCGYGQTGSDFMFKKNVAGARAAGVKIGVYLYSYAYTADMAKKEAKNTLKLMKAAGITTSNLALPVYYDLEEQAGKSKPCVKSGGKYHYVSNATLGAMAKAYASEITKAGYKVGIYANKNWWTNFLTNKAFSNASWSKWVAQYGKSCTYKGSYDIWQYSSSGRVSGISTRVDMNYLYRTFDSKVATATVTPSNIESPLFVPKGSTSIGLGGSLSSTAAMKSVTISVYKGQTTYGETPTGSLVKSYTAYPGSKTFNLGSIKDLDGKLGINGLAAGDYTYQIKVGIEDANKQVFSDSFKVVSSPAKGQEPTNERAYVTPALIDYAKPSSKASGFFISTGITKGKNLSFKGGKVTSSVTMSQLTASLINAKTGKVLATWTTKPNAKSVALPTSLASKLATNKLPYGKYTVRIQVKSSTATTTAYSKSFTVGVSAPSVTKTTAGKKKLTAKWKKVSGATGYQVRYSRYQSFKSDYYKSTKSTSKTIKVKKSKHRYYYQVRSYKLVGGVKCYGSWGSAHSVKVK